MVNFKGLKALGIVYGRSHIDRLENAERFPKSFKLGDHRNSPRVWFLEEVLAWIRSRANRR